MIPGVSRINEQMMAERIDYLQEKVSILVENVERSFDFPVLRQFGERYVRNLSQGPLGTIFRLGSTVMKAIRRSGHRTGDSDRQHYDYHYNYEEYESIPSHGYYQW